MADHVNWIDFFNLNKDAVQQQADDSQQLGDYESRLLDFEARADTDRRNGINKQYADYSDYQDLMREAASRARSGAVSSVDKALGYQDGNNRYGEAFAASQNRMSQQLAASDDRANRMRAEQEAQVNRYRSLQTGTAQDKVRQEAERQRLIRQGQLVTDRDKAWTNEQGKFFSVDHNDYNDWYNGWDGNAWGAAKFRGPSYASTLSESDRNLLSEYDKGKSPYWEWYRKQQR